MGVKSNSLVQMESIFLMLGVAPTTTPSPNNSSKGASSRWGLIEEGSFDQAITASLIKLASPLECSSISNTMYRAKGREEASKVNALTVVPMGVLGEDEATSDEEF